MEIIEPSAIGARLREKRHKHGLTQQQMSEILGISEAYYGRVERGERMLSINLAATVNRKFNISLDYLLLGELPNPEGNNIINEINSIPSDIRKPLDELVKGISKLASELMDDTAKR